jgi:predicted CoA-binding protein
VRNFAGSRAEGEAMKPPMKKPTVAVVGASANRNKFGNKAVRAFTKAGFEVYPVNPRGGEIEGLRVYTSLDNVPAGPLDRVSFYVPPDVGLAILDQVARRDVGELWLNPGSDSPALVDRARMLGLNVVQACSILAVGERPESL